MHGNCVSNRPGVASRCSFMDDKRSTAIAQLSHFAWQAAQATGLIIILVVSSQASLAQDGPPARDPIMLSVTKAQNEGRLLDAEKILRDAIADTEQQEPKSPRMGNYLRRLAMIVEQKGQFSEAMALNRRSLDVDRIAFGPTGLRVADDLEVIASLTLSQGNQEEAEQLLKEALEIAEINRAHLQSTYTVDGVLEFSVRSQTSISTSTGGRRPSLCYWR